MDKQISLMELAKVLRKKATVIIISTLIGLIASLTLTFFVATPQYDATTQLLVNQNRGELDGLEMNDININISLIDTYTELIKGPAILNVVSEELGGSLTSDQLSSMINISAPQNAQVFNLTITHTDPYTAAEIANTVAVTFQEEIGEIMNSVDNVVITYPAEPRLTPISPKHALNISIGTVFGVMLGVVLGALQYVMDGTLRDTEFITEEIGWNDLGSIHEIKPEEVEHTEINRHTVKYSRLS